MGEKRRDLPSTLTLSVGEEQNLVLPSLATAGYRWEYQIDNPGVLAVTRRFADAGAPGKQSSMSPRDELVVLRGRALGVARMRFAQRRSWETVTPIAAHELKVHVVPAAAAGPPPPRRRGASRR